MSNSSFAIASPVLWDIDSYTHTAIGFVVFLTNSHGRHIAERLSDFVAQIDARQWMPYIPQEELDHFKTLLAWAERQPPTDYGGIDLTPESHLIHPAHRTHQARAVVAGG